MAACSLAASRMRDGSITGSYDHGPTSVHISPEVFIQAAESCLPLDITHVTTLDALRAYPLLALSAIQGRRIDVMHKYIGIYFAILNIRQWHDESNWPSTWTSTEKEEMRRLYWSMYTLDVFSSIVWNGCVHFQEAHARVQYPSGGTDNVSHQRVSAAAKWIVGWNFTTDLYRVLEHAVSRSRTRYSHFNILDVTTSTPSAFSSGLNDRVNTLYLALPEAFKTIDEMTGDAAKDIYGFQSANIQATLALLRMVLFSVEADSDVDKKCSVASDLLAVFHRIPKSYLRAISAPLVYHLSGIGQILSSVVTSPMSEASYAKVRELMFSMATLLETLESVLQKRAGAAKSLLDQVDRIDQFMATQRRAQLQAQAVPQARTDMNEWASPSVAEEISFRYQLPNDIVGDWSWPLDFDDTSNTFFEWYNNA
ncbi:Hypothetical protein D9617_43g040370 [Elsinoe fawcettii]|nr:Hypothetical protein D9617_43g040370 [Elsinoe fawcettii]